MKLNNFSISETMISPSPSQHKQEQDPSSMISEPFFAVNERSESEEKSNNKPSLLNESQTSVEKAYDKLDTRYPWYSFWLFMMILISGFFFILAVAVKFNALHRNPSMENLNDLVLFVAFTGTAFAQYILEIWAIYTRDLTRAILALKIVKVNTFTFLGLNVLTGYNLYEHNTNITQPSESTTFRRVLLTFCLIVVSVFSLTQIFITHFQATKVRNNLAKREAIRAQLRSH